LETKKIANKINVGIKIDISLLDLFNTIRYSGPDSLLRSFSDDNQYDFGFYYTKTNSFENYILTKINIYDSAFSGMLEWENSIGIDLENIFIFKNITSTTTLATSSNNIADNPAIKIENKENEGKFVDKVIKNIDTRVYVDTKKNTKIVYGIVNKRYLLITSGEESFINILDKLIINSILR
jgi:hypothetical protein